MENNLSTPKKTSKKACASEPRHIRTPLSVLQNNKNLYQRTLTPSSKQEFSDHDSAFILEMLEDSKSTEKPSKLPLPLVFNPSKLQPSKNISQILHSFRTKQIKSILKNPQQTGQKNVKFSEEAKISERKPEIKSHSISTTTNSVTESRIEPPIEEFKRGFRYEEEVRSSLAVSDVDEYPTVAYCSNCRREIVTVVNLEKIRESRNILGSLHWYMCWCLPACMYNNTNLVHRCSFCNNEIMRIISN